MLCLQDQGEQEVTIMSSIKTDITVESLGGIDTRPSRERSRFSTGQNFYSSGGSIYTRPGTTEIESTFTGEIVAMFQAPLPGSKTTLIAQQGNKLYHWVDGVWTEKYTLTSSDPIQATRFINKLLMVNGTDRVSYDIGAGTYETLVAISGTTIIPALEYITVWKFRPFGWMPSTSSSHVLYFAGYDANSVIDPKVWPPTFTLNIGGSSGSPIFGVFPAGNHMIALTESTYVPIYGSTEDDFEIGTAGETNVLRPGVIENINDLVMWVGKDVTDRMSVYLYSGTDPVSVEAPIQGFLGDIDLSTLYTKSFLSQFWIICPSISTTKVFVYDTKEREWFVYLFPFKIVSGSVFGEYLNDDFIILGSSSRVIKLDPQAITDIDDNDIITSFTWGPFSIESRKLKPKSLHVTSTAHSNFTLGVIQVADDNTEPVSQDLSFSAVSPVKQVTKVLRVTRDIGYNISYRITTSDKVNRLTGMSLVVKGKGLK